MESDTPEQATTGHSTVLGVDLGVNQLAVTSTGTFWSGHEFDHWQREYEKRRASLQQCGSRHAHENIQAVGRKETGRFKMLLHRIANGIIEHHDEFDVIPSNKAMDGLKDMLVTQVANSEMRLKIAVDELDHDYDFILIDCPPDLSQILDNALLTAEQVLIPVEPTRRSIRAIEKMNEEIAYLSNSFPGQIDTIDILGIIINAVESVQNNDTKQMIEFFNDAPYDVFQVPDRVAIRRAWNNGVSIFTHEDDAKTEDAREAYTEIVKMLERQTTEVEA